MADEDKTEELKKWIVEQSTDLLVTAGEVIQAVRARDLEDGGFDCDMQERVIVAQLLALVASGRSLHRSSTEVRQVADAAVQAAKDQLAEVQRRVARQLPPEVRRAMLAPPPMGFDGPQRLYSPSDYTGLKLSVHNAKNGGWIVTLFDGRTRTRECKDTEELLNALGWAAMAVTKPAAPEPEPDAT